VRRRGHVKVRYEGRAHSGLEEYVSTRQLVVRWSERRALLRDEERLGRLRQSGRRDPTREEAVGSILAASGEPSAAVGEWLSMPAHEVQRRRGRAERAASGAAPAGVLDRR
jgi:hypothetical protein